MQVRKKDVHKLAEFGIILGDIELEHTRMKKCVEVILQVSKEWRDASAAEQNLRVGTFATAEMVQFTDERVVEENKNSLQHADRGRFKV